MLTTANFGTAYDDYLKRARDPFFAVTPIWPSNERVHSYGLAKSGPYSTFSRSRRRPAVVVSQPTPRLLRHRHPTSNDENHRAALPLRGGGFSLSRSEFRTAEASREKRQS